MDVVLNDRELEVMQVLWGSGPSSVAEVRATLGQTEEGRAHRYHPDRASAGPRERGRAADKALVSGFAGALITHVVSRKKPSKEVLRRLRALLNDQLPEVEG